MSIISETLRGMARDLVEVAEAFEGVEAERDHWKGKAREQVCWDESGVTAGAGAAELDEHERDIPA